MRLGPSALLVFATQHAIGAVAAADQHFYVANQRRLGGVARPHEGSLADPFDSIFDARDALRRGRPLAAGTRFVHLEGGPHYLRNPFELDAELDSGTPDSPIVYTSYPGQRATLSGGTPLPASAFSDITLHGVPVKAVNLSAHGINASTIGGFGNPHPGPRLELFFGGRAMTPAREPNIGSAEDATLWNWVGYENLTGPVDPAGTMQFGFADTDRAARWAQNLATGSLWLHGFWKFDWRDTFVEVESITATSEAGAAPYVVTVSKATPPQYPFSKGARFYAVGHSALLDAPSEYHVNASTGMLYFYPPLNGGFDSGTPVVVSTLPNALVVPAGTTDVSYTDLTIEVSQGTAAEFTGVERVTVHNCTVRSAGGACVSLNGLNSDVTASTVAECGHSGISTSGGNFATLQHQNLSVVGNYVANTSRIVRTYQPGVGFSTVGCYYANNTIFNSPHTAMQGGCNDNVFEYNRIIKASYECTDTGAFYVGRSWSQRGNVARYNYFQDVKATEKLAQQSCSQNAFYLDDEMSGWEFYGNTIVNSTTGVLLGGGRRNTIRDNVFLGNQQDIAFDNRGMNWQTGYCAPNCTGTACFLTNLEGIHYQQPPYSVKYPEITTIYQQQPCVPVFNDVSGNTYCHATSPGGGKFIDRDAATIEGWNSTISNNTNVCP